MDGAWRKGEWVSPVSNKAVVFPDFGEVELYSWQFVLSSGVIGKPISFYLVFYNDITIGFDFSYYYYLLKKCLLTCINFLF